MSEPISDSDLELLRQKHGQEPLVNLVRMLIVAVDQTKAGTEQRNKTIQLLKFLTKQDNISPSSSSWLDWLESIDETELNWDNFDTPAETSSSGRKVVEIEDTEPVGERPKIPPLSKEQMIWAKALDRQENKNSYSRYFVKLLALAILALIGWGLWSYGPMLKEKILAFKLDSPSKSEYLVTPLDLWGNFQSKLYSPKYLDLSKESLTQEFLGSLETQNMPLLARDWIAAKKNQMAIQAKDHSAIYWLGLRELEHRFFGDQTHVNDISALNSLQPGNRHWKFNREIKGQTLYHGNFIESFTKTSQGWDLQIKKLINKNGIAHRVIIDSSGLYAWSWRLVWNGINLEGRVLRTQSGDYKIHCSKAWSEEIEFTIMVNQLNHLPAIWCPSFHQLQPDAMLFPLSGEFCKGTTFWADNQISTTPKGFQLKSSREDWIENWVLVN